ncbi:hypothetical protein LBMAG57_26450 [Verrucomicrobiota bacterium]|nr:hypothetical protein LBMAG57_26450 [Verrucomicrobiota bacterium]
MKPRDFFAILLREGLAIVVEHLGGWVTGKPRRRGSQPPKEHKRQPRKKR